MIFGFNGFAAVAALKRRGGCGAATFRWCGYDWRDSLYLGLVSAEAKAAYLVHLWYVVSLGTIENVRASASRTEAVSIVLRDHRLSETTNIEKVGPTYFLNLFRTVISLCRLVMAIVCKLCPKEKLPPHFAKSGGKRLR